jgi:uncharacterized membrane protein
MNKLHVHKELSLYVISFLISGVTYYEIEILFRDFSTFSMFLLAGFLGIIISQINNITSFETDYVAQIICSAIIITMLEGLAGLIINQDFQIWDYRNMPFGTFFYGQCNVVFMGAWGLISAFGIPILDYFEWIVYDHKAPDLRPYYKIFGRKIDILNLL